MSWRGKIGLMGVVWLTAVFRFHALFANRFHSDEALFAWWARLIAVWRDPLLLTPAVDKPPLLFYMQALFYPLQGAVEWAARLPNFIASLVLVPLLAVLVWRWYGDEETAVLAALFLALSPFAIQFSATAFTDPLLGMWIIASLVVASGGWRVPVTRHFTAGLLFGLALATKYQAWLFLPLLVGVGWLAGWRWREWRRFAVGLLLLVAALLLWDFARTGQFSLWGRQMDNFGGVRLSWSWELWPRLAAWGQLWWYAWASPLVMGLVVLAVGRPLLSLAKNSLQRDELMLSQAEGGTKEQRDLLDQFLALFVLAYAVVHWLLAAPVWDRYLLALIPLVAILIARLLKLVSSHVTSQYLGTKITKVSELALHEHSDAKTFVISQFIEKIRSHLLISHLPSPISQYIIFGLLLFVLLPAAWAGRNGRFPIGGFPEADGGAAEIAAYLYDEPYGTVLYDHWYSWQWRYHLFDRGVYVNWVPHPAQLAEDLTVFGGGATVRYVVLANDGRERPFLRAVAAAGFSLEPIPEAGGASMTLYRIYKQ